MLGTMLVGAAVKAAPYPLRNGIARKDMTPGNHIPKVIGFLILFVIGPIWCVIFQANKNTDPGAIWAATAVVVFGLPVVIFTAWIATAMIAATGVNRTPAKPAGRETPGEQNARRMRERAARIAGTMPATGQAANTPAVRVQPQWIKERNASSAAAQKALYGSSSSSTHFSEAELAYFRAHAVRP